MSKEQPSSFIREQDSLTVSLPSRLTKGPSWVRELFMTEELSQARGSVEASVPRTTCRPISTLDADAPLYKPTSDVFSSRSDEDNPETPATECGTSFALLASCGGWLPHRPSDGGPHDEHQTPRRLQIQVRMHLAVNLLHVQHGSLKPSTQAATDVPSSSAMCDGGVVMVSSDTTSRCTVFTVNDTKMHV